MACFHPSECQQLSCRVNIQSISAGTLQRQQILTTRTPPSYANDPQDAQEVWIIIIINITIITFRHHPSYANDPRGAEAVSTPPSYRRLPRRKLAHILLVHGIAVLLLPSSHCRRRIL